MINNERENRLFPSAASIYVTCVTAHSQTLFRSWLQEIVYFFRTVAWGAGWGAWGSGFWSHAQGSFRIRHPESSSWSFPTPTSPNTPADITAQGCLRIGFPDSPDLEGVGVVGVPFQLPLKPPKQRGLF